MPCTSIPFCHELLLLAIGLSNGAIIALNALGFTLIYAAVRTINLAYGDVFALASVAAASALATKKTAAFCISDACSSVIDV
jgi:branched-subunit amino acid ABC-type transport system permease component